MKRMKFLKTIGLAAMFVLFGAVPALGQGDENGDLYEGEAEAANREPAASETGGRLGTGQLNKARYRLYPGGQDEEDLKVQESLPIPTRYPDGNPAAPTSTGMPPQDN